MLGTDPKAEFGEGSSAQELRMLIAESATGGHLDRSEADMLTGVFRLHERQARQIMTPAPSVATVDSDATAEEAIRRSVQSGHTRLIVVDPQKDARVVGVVHASALAQLLLDAGPDASLARAIRQPLIVPETKPIDDLLSELRQQRSSLAIVADEYGRTAGLVSVEDIVEEIVGEILDETDPLAGPARRLPNGDWIIRGEATLDDLADHGILLEPPPDSTSNSIAGIILDQLGRAPKQGETLELSGHQLRIQTMRGNRIATVRLSRPVPDVRAE